MKQIVKIFTVLVAIVVMGAGQAWADTTVGNIIVKTTVGGSIGFYANADCSGTAITTAAPDDIVYMKLTPDFAHTIYEILDEKGITVEKSTGSGVLQSRRNASMTELVTVEAIDATKGIYAFTMPKDETFGYIYNVSVTVEFPEKAKVDVAYINADGVLCDGEGDHPAKASAYVLDGTENVLGLSGETVWYVSNTPNGITFTNDVTLAGDVCIILADGSAMTVQGYISGAGKSLYLYGQEGSTGSLDFESIACNDVTITGGVISSENRDGNVIACSNNISITGGQVTIPGSNNGYGSLVASGDRIYLGWTLPTDCYNIGIYDAPLIALQESKRFVAYDAANGTAATAVLSNSVSKDSEDHYSSVNGMWLRPLNGYTVNVADGISLMDGTTAKTADFTITTGAGTESEVTTPYYIYKASTEQNPVTVTLSYSGTDFVKLGGLPEGTTFNDVENQPMQRSFAMPAQDVALTTDPVTNLTANGDTYTYDGTAKTPTIKLGNDVFAATNYVVAYKKGGSAVSEAKKVGTYSCTVNGSGSYIGTIATDVAITINPKTVTVTSGITASNKTYDGTTTATLNGKNAVISGKVDGDVLGVSASGAFANKNAGNNKTVNINSITLTGNDKGNYTLATTDSQKSTTANISKKALTVTADDKSVSYGDAAPTYTASYSGFVSGESKSNLGGSLKFSCAYTSGSDTGSYTIKPSGLSSNNYSISYADGTLTVNPALVSYIGGTITQDEDGYDVSLNEGTGSANPLPSDIDDIDDLDYSRTLTAPGSGDGDTEIDGQEANLYTVCLPFAPKTGTGVKYYTLASVSGTTLKFTEVTTALAEFTPYLVAVIGSSNIIESCSDVSFETTHAIASTTKDGFTLTGTLTGLSNTKAAKAAGTDMVTYILQHDAKWGKVVSDNSSVYIPPFRAFITGPDVTASGVRELDSSFEGEGTGIDSILTVDADGTERWYDLNGRRIDAPTKKGIYIRNGKKEIRK